MHIQVNESWRQSIDAWVFCQKIPDIENITIQEVGELFLWKMCCVEISK